MSIKSDFDAILKDWGHNVYLQRATLDEHNNRVYSTALEQHTTRYTVGIHRNLPRTQDEAMEGVLNPTDRTYYFRSDVNPYEGDRIYDYLDRAENDQEVWLINSSVAMRGEDGQISFWVAGVTRIIPN